MSKPLEYVGIKVEGLWYRAEPYGYRSCQEVLIRGPFIGVGGPFQSNGKPRFKQGHHTAFKLNGFTPSDPNPKYSKKNLVGDPVKAPDWRPFYEAYATKKGWIE